MDLKKYLHTVILILCVCMLNAQTWMAINSNNPKPVAIDLTEDNLTSTTITVELGGFMLNQVNTPRGDAFTVSVGESSPILEKGMPDLPKVTASLVIPGDANMDATVISSRYKDYTNLDIAPSKGNLTRDTDPASVAYTYGPAYNVDAYYPASQTSLREPYIIRDYRGQTLIVNPFAYNPVTRTLRVYYEITVSIKANGRSTINILPDNAGEKPLSIDFKNIYQRHFLNSTDHNRYTPLEEYGKMLIICYPDFMDEMQPFIDWKRKTGIPVEIVDVATIGTNATAIKNYVAQYYADNGLTYLLLVGDNAQVPTITSGTNLGGPSDVAYGYLAGDDHYPDIFVGRFSAETEAQVVTQVQRSVTYEQNPMVSVDWLSKGFGIGSNQGPGDDNEYDYEHMQNIRTDLLGFTYSYVGELYDGSQGGEDAPGNPGPSDVAAQVNDGRTIINYVGHGSDISWGTTGFSNSNVNQLTNNDKWPFIFSVACVNGNFLNQTCFAEAWLRASNANGPTGAVATLMSTINQSWDPPMDGQDEMNDILTESYPDNIKRTFGGVTMNGCMKMNDTYGAGGFEMTDTWLIFGDPSLMLRTAMPAQLTVTHSNVAFIGSTQFSITCPVDGALACLTLNGEIQGTAIVSGGTAVIDIPALSDVGMMTLAVTAFNYLPYMADIEIIPLNGAYVTYNNTVINDANENNNQQLDYGETVTMAVGFKNAGTEDVENVMITLSTDDQYTTLNDSTELYPVIAAGQIVTIPDGFGITVSNDIPEGHVINMNFIAVADTNQWEGTFEINAHTAILNFAGMTLNDEEGNNNGRLDQGETVMLNLTIINAGTAPAYNVNGVLTTEDPYLLINVDTVYYGMLNSYQTLQASYMITALPSAPSGHQSLLNFSMFADDNITGISTPSVTIGQIPVLIIDLDLNHNSGPVIETSLSNIGIASDYVTSWPLVIGPYQSVFVCLGSYPSNYVLTTGQGNALTNFMNNHSGKVYMEGADTWAFNQQTSAHAMFKIDGTSDGESDLSTINGANGTFTEGMSFSFLGDNSYIDHIVPMDTAFVIFSNASPSYNTTVAYNGGSYKTIGSSFEFGGLVDGAGTSVKDSVMNAYINFMGLQSNATLLANFIASDTEFCESSEITYTDYSAGNIISWQWTFEGGIPETSTEQNPLVTYRDEGIYDVTLTISDGLNNYTTTKTDYITVQNCTAVSDIRTNEITIYPNPAKDHFMLILPDNNTKTDIKVYSISGNEVISGITYGTSYKMDVTGLSPGVYFVKLNNQLLSNTLKLIIRR